jgi:hypothetical protein
MQFLGHHLSCEAARVGLAQWWDLDDDSMLAGMHPDDDTYPGNVIRKILAMVYEKLRKFGPDLIAGSSAQWLPAGPGKAFILFLVK